jgi:hypothetical protein
MQDGTAQSVIRFALASRKEALARTTANAHATAPSVAATGAARASTCRMKGDVGAVERMAARARNLDKAQRRLNKALRKKDARRGKGPPQTPQGQAQRRAPPAAVFRASSEALRPAPDVYRFRRRLVRAKCKASGRRMFHVAEVGGTEEEAGVAVVVAKRLRSADERVALAIANKLCPERSLVPHDAVDARRMLLLRTDDDALHTRLFGAAPGDRDVYASWHVPRRSEGRTPLFFLTGGAAAAGALLPKTARLDAPLFRSLQTQALRLLELVEVGAVREPAAA